MKDCIFCKIGRHEARYWMVAESEHAFAILNIYPMNI
jgi:diadenosine tetraphosphate (Ap4A) HIT family hydrolase